VFLKKAYFARSKWLMPVILVTWEVDNGRITNTDWLGQKVHKIPSQQKKAAMVYTSVILIKAESIKLEDQGPGLLVQKARPCLQNNESKKGWKCGSSGKALA
jgi:hypothetical protein